ncbi:hypothetical protein N480_10645 [Pseudoalteromonas luteoviolacea S2607]|uniref:hypothetical protein n=1 Tax=Pseudoalteromonas luteoviolacea TaxID=43657 RepID=UPI0007B0BA6F|nr:hypothetical protein [Pseudoalteromonas luteoviolacea]KZN28543.1 hypothetical protein N480_10645 [Pseudoalteromonas luteoviolacea S2607]
MEIQTYLNDVCAFDATQFTSEKEVKAYFTEENFIAMFGDAETDFAMDQLADSAIGLWEDFRAGK